MQLVALICNSFVQICYRAYMEFVAVLIGDGDYHQEG